MSGPAEITNLMPHKVRGEDRWTGRLSLPGLGTVNVLVAPVEGRLVAFQLRCPHAARDLTKGDIVEGHAIECPSHGWVIPLSRLKAVEVVRDETGRLFAGAAFKPPEGGQQPGFGDLPDRS